MGAGPDAIEEYARKREAVELNHLRASAPDETRADEPHHPNWREQLMQPAAAPSEAVRDALPDAVEIEDDVLTGVWNSSAGGDMIWPDFLSRHKAVIESAVRETLLAVARAEKALELSKSQSPDLYKHEEK